jgi:uncharacterized protein YcsI (UPF0317 family)
MNPRKDRVATGEEFPMREFLEQGFLECSNSNWSNKVSADDLVAIVVPCGYLFDDATLRTQIVPAARQAWAFRT